MVRAPRPVGAPHEVVEEPPELALDIDVAVRPPHEPSRPSRAEPRPDPPARQVERDRDPGDQAQRTPSRRSPAPGPLGDEQRVLAERPSSSIEMPSSSDDLPSPRRSATARSSGRPAVPSAFGGRRPGTGTTGRRRCRRPRVVSSSCSPRSRPGHRQRPVRAAAGRDRSCGTCGVPQRSPARVADDEVRRRPEPVLVERVPGRPPAGR